MAKSTGKVTAKITIELVTKKPETGSGMPDLAQDAYTFKKEIPEIRWHGKDGKGNYRMGDKYRIASLKVEQEVTQAE